MIDVLDPLSGQVDRRLEIASTDQIAASAAALRAAQPAWEALGVHCRCAAMNANAGFVAAPMPDRARRSSLCC
jgi:acyl-CoA reductase-like NAD-dependent aldehyde dehydrogenase